MLWHPQLHYDINDEQTLRLVEVATVIFIPAAFLFSPLSDRLGLRAVVILSCFFIAAGGIVRWREEEGYWSLVIGQALNGLAGPVIMNAPPQLAAEFFPLRQRTTATAVAWGAQLIGVALGYAIFPRLVPTPAKIPEMNFVLAVMCLGTFAVSFTFPGKPPNPPTTSASMSKLGFFEGMVVLAGKPMYVMLAVTVGVTGGLSQGWGSFFNVFLDDQFSDKLLGNIATGCYLSSIVGTLAVGLLVDVFGLQRNLKAILVVIFVIWTALIAAFMFLVYYASWEVELYQIGAVYISFGLINGASGPIALELAAEIAFPVAEETAASYLTIIWQVVNVIVMETFYRMDNRMINWVTVGGLAFCTLVLVPIKSTDARIKLDDVRGLA